MGNTGRRRVKIRKRRSLVERLRTVQPGLKGVLVLSVAAALLGGGGYAALRHARECPALWIRVEGIDIAGLPAWLDPESRKEFLNPQPDILPAEINLLDRRPLHRLSAHFQQCEWVRAVDRLEYVFPGRVAPGGIVGRLTLHEPLCVVALKPAREYFFAGARRQRLGGPLAELPDSELRLPIIHWAWKLPPRGGPWGEEPLHHGFDIAELLEQEGLRFDLPHWIARIDVTGVGRLDRSEILLVTEHQVHLQWGRSTRSESSGRPELADTDQKIHQLRRVLAGEFGVPQDGAMNLFEPLEAQGGATGWLSARPP